MNDFEFAFSLYSLLLGFSLAQLIGGLARILEVRLVDQVDDDSLTRIGWLTPLLAVFVLLDLMSFWSAAWGARDLIIVSPTVLLCVVAFASCYYLAAYLVFPSGTMVGRDLDEHFFGIRRVVISLLFILLAAQVIFYASVPQLLVRLQSTLAVVLTIVLVALMTLAMILRRKLMVGAVLAALIARYVIIYLL